MEKLRIGVIGCGEIAQIMHLPFLRELRDLFEIAGVCDISRELVNQVGDIYHIGDRYTEYEELLCRADIDAVAILTNACHAEIAVAAARSRKHIFIEKPLCFNLEEADEMIAAAGENAVTLMVGYMKRYDPGYEWAQARLRQITDLRLIRVHDLFGQLCMRDCDSRQGIFTLYRYKDVPSEVMERTRAEMEKSLQKAIGTTLPKWLNAFSMLLGLGSHDATILRGAFGDPLRVHSADVFPPDGGYVVAILEYPNDVRCMWEVGGFDKEGEWWDQELAAFGVKDAVKVCFPNPYLPYAPTIVRSWGTGEGISEREESVTASYDEAFRREWRHFHQCVTKAEEPLTSGIQAKRDIQLLIDIIRAAM